MKASKPGPGLTGYCTTIGFTFEKEAMLSRVPSQLAFSLSSWFITPTSGTLYVFA